ncbi:MAG: hypothetical protein LBS84_10960 [Clostridiales bacterium]|jgi:sugar phosphate isomerase/epimerase|nr:hypothetical protein [Clostridiales bacterium]
MRIGYTVWPWTLVKDESTGKLSTNPGVIRPMYETALKEISYLGYNTVETFTPIIDAYEGDSRTFSKLHEKYNLQFVCLYAHLSHDFDTDLKELERSIRFMREMKRLRRRDTMACCASS